MTISSNILQPGPITKLRHPFVAEAYIKTDFSDRSKPRVLVIQSIPSAREDLLSSFLEDFDLITENLMNTGQTFDRVDIKIH